MSETDQTADQLLKSIWNFSTFRKDQKSAIDSICTGTDTLVVMPTGSGKSLIYQMATLLNNWKTLIISPLIALMDDQVLSCREKSLSACALHSQISTRELNQNLGEWQHTPNLFTFISPERAVKYCLQRKLNLTVDLLVIDEAHCISKWGHDFRKDYRRLGELRKRLNCPVLALTATATPFIQKDIIKQLHMKKTRLLVSGFARENIELHVAQKAKTDEKLNALLTILQKEHQLASRALIYTSTRKMCDRAHEFLNDKGLQPLKYHAGMNDPERMKAQQDFSLQNEGIMIATSAFGMGIDLPNIHLLIHLQCPANPESYYQETGRAGRDGKNARCHLLYGPADFVIQEQLLRKGDLKGNFFQERLRSLRFMKNFVQSRQCRANMILEYFNEESGHCGICDNCRTNSPQVLADPIFRITHEDKNQITQAVEQMPGLLGVLKLSRVLNGKKPDGKNNYPWENLTCFGSLSHLKLKDIQSELKAMIDHEELILRDGKYPRVSLPSTKNTTFKKLFNLSTAEKKPKQKTESSEITRMLNNFIRREGRARKLKPYYILKKDTIFKIAESKPTKLNELQQIKGLGPVKIESYGHEILKIVTEAREHSEPEPTAHPSDLRTMKPTTLPLKSDTDIKNRLFLSHKSPN